MVRVLRTAQGLPPAVTVLLFFEMHCNRLRAGKGYSRSGFMLSGMFPEFLVCGLSLGAKHTTSYPQWQTQAVDLYPTAKRYACLLLRGDEGLKHT